ncbi:MAG: DUF3108 domain-containing protein [Chlorobi bacterium]|nr:DUF3108 domain-containing protein [Chlorobiota bacterium]
MNFKNGTKQNIFFHKKIKLVSIIIFVSIALGKVIFAQSNTEPYKSGEKLTYLLHFGWLDGGEALLTLEKKLYQNKEVYYANTTARSIGIADVLYQVYDVYESYFNSETGLPIKAIRNIKEGNYRYYNEVLFFHAEDSVLSQKSGKHAIPKNCYDMLSALYVLRKKINSNFKNGDTLRIETFFGDEVFPMVFRYRGKETISTKLGEINCLKLVPVVEVGRVFKSEDDMIIWLADKPNHVPIRIRFDLLVGSIKFDLIEFENLKYGL